MSDFVQKPVQAILDFFKANPWAYAYLGHLDYLGKYNIGNFWKDAVGGYKWAAQGATGALKWASKGWDNAARTFNNATGLSKYGNGQDDWEKSDLGKWGKRAAFLSEERVEGLYAAYQIGGYIIVGVILGGSIIVALGLGFGIGFAILEGIVSVIAFLGPLGIVMVGAGFLCSRQPAGSCQYMSGG